MIVISSKRVVYGCCQDIFDDLTFFIQLLFWFRIMNSQIEQRPILIYYKFRGQMQPIRNLFSYLGIPFLQIHLDCFEQQKRNFPPQLFLKINKFKIDKSQLPSLIHKNYLVEGVLPLMTYICQRYDRQDLLGTDIRARARLQQIMEIYFNKQPNSMTQLFKMAEFAYKSTCKQIIDHFIKETYENVMKSSNYIKQLCQMLDVQQQPSFILGNISLIDFFFLQTCFYMLGMFACKDRVYIEELAYVDFNKIHFLEKPSAYYLKVMKRYLKMMKNQPFYVQNQDYLQSFSIISKMIREQNAQGLRKVWIGNLKFVI